MTMSISASDNIRTRIRTHNGLLSIDHKLLQLRGVKFRGVFLVFVDDAKEFLEESMYLFMLFLLVRKVHLLIEVREHRCFLCL